MVDYLYTVTPVGRLIRGSLTERSTHKYGGEPYPEGQGPREVGLAITKGTKETNDYLTALYNKAVADAPALKPKIDEEFSSGFTAGKFAFKIRDGDKANEKGEFNKNTAGCWVLNLSTYIDLKYTYTDAYGLKLTDPMGQPIPPRSDIAPSHIKIGDFAHVAVSVKWNEKSDGTAGIYQSQSAFMLAAHGDAINSGPSIDQAFANIPMGALPTGASVASVTAPNAAPGLPAPAPQPVAAPAPAGVSSLPTASPTPSTVQPHTAFLTGATGGMPPLPGQG